TARPISAAPRPSAPPSAPATRPAKGCSPSWRSGRPTGRPATRPRPTTAAPRGSTRTCPRAPGPREANHSPGGTHQLGCRWLRLRDASTLTTKFVGATRTGAILDPGPSMHGGLAMTDRDDATPWVDGQTVGGVLRATAARHPDRDAVVFPALGVRRSWAELD